MNQTELVDKYSELAGKKKRILDEIEREMNKLKEEIVNYAKENDVKIMFGSNKNLYVNILKNFKFPPKSSEQRNILESLLKELNRWGEISTLDTFALNKIVLNEKWPVDVLERVKEFGRFEEISRLSLRDKQEVVVRGFG